MQLPVSKVPKWLRWLLTPLASPLAFLVVTIVGNIAAKIFVFVAGERGMSENFFTYLIVPAASGYFAVQVAAVVAPTRRKIVALVFASIWVALCGASTFWIFVGTDYKYLLVIAATAAGASVAALQEEEELASTEWSR